MSEEATHAFTNEMLAELRGKFFAPVSDPRKEKQFFQERSMLIQAITHPAAWMEKKGVELPLDSYREILRTVIRAIKQHGCKTKHRFSAYFLHCVQERMKHLPDTYYDLAKANRDGRHNTMKQAGAVAAETLKAIKRAPDGAAVRSATQILAAANRLVSSPGGRKKKKQPAATQPDLFARGRQ